MYATCALAMKMLCHIQSTCTSCYNIIFAQSPPISASMAGTDASDPQTSSNLQSGTSTPSASVSSAELYPICEPGPSGLQQVCHLTSPLPLMILHRFPGWSSVN